MCFRSGAAGIAAPGDSGKSVLAPTEGRGALVAEGSGVQAGLVETDREVTV